jgi:hypothetical protein
LNPPPASQSENAYGSWSWLFSYFVWPPKGIFFHPPFLKGVAGPAPNLGSFFARGAPPDKQSVD